MRVLRGVLKDSAVVGMHHREKFLVIVRFRYRSPTCIVLVGCEVSDGSESVQVRF